MRWLPETVTAVRCGVRFLGLAVAAALVACGGGGDPAGSTPTDPGGSAPTVSLSATSLPLAGIGTAGPLSATVSPSSATLSWNSSNPAVATVSGSGASATVTAVAVGSAQITVTATNAGRTATADAAVVVTGIVRQMVLAPSSLSLTAGTSQRVAPTITADAGAVRTVQWSSDDATIVTVDTSGLLTAVAPGQTTVRATSVASPSVNATVAVRVNAVPKVRAVVVSPTIDSALTGQSKTFSAVVTADSGLATTVTWRSSAPSVATVDATGRATAVGAGAATITAVSLADTTIRASATFTVRIPAVRSVSFTLPSTLTAGRSADAVPTITADNGADVRVTWTSSAPAVATIDNVGHVLAVGAGTTTITLRSAAFTNVSSSATLQVSLPPSTSIFSELNIGAGGGLSTARMNNIFATSASNGIVLPDASAPNIAGVASPLQLGVPTWQLRSDLMTNFFGRFGGDADGSSPNDVFWALAGDTFSGFPTTTLVARWNGSTLANTNWPLPTGSTSPTARGLSSIGVGEALALTSLGGVNRYRANVWSELAPASAATSGTGISAWTADSAVVTRCRTGATDSRVGILRAGTVTLLPNTTVGDDPTFAGCGRSPIALANGDFYVALDRAVARYSSGTFSALTPALDQGEWFYHLALCGSTLYAGTSEGRIFRATGTQLTLVSEVGEAANGSVQSMHCAGDGTLRVGSNAGLVTRYVGGVWSDEHAAPRLTAISLQSPEAGLATGSSGTAWRWNGTNWSRVRRDSRDFLTASYLAPDGRMFVGGSITRTSTSTSATFGLMLRYNGSAWVRDEFNNAIGDLPSITGLWGTSSSNVFATVSATGQGRVLRFDGTSWSTVVSGATRLLAINGVAPTFAVAVGTGGVAYQWNGTTWTTMAPAPAANSNVLVNSVLALSPTLVFAGASSCDAFTPGGLWKWNGTTWADAGLTVAGFSNCVVSLFGTGPTDVFAVIKSPSSGGVTPPNQLVRWNGSTWNAINTSLVAQAEKGAAVPGLTAIVGGLSRVIMGTVPAAARAQLLQPAVRRR